MSQLFSNNAVATLLASISDLSTTITLSSGSEVLFPVISAPSDFFVVTLEEDQEYEILKVTATAGNSFTVVRAQEGTIARDWAAGTTLELRLTAGGIQKIQSDIGTTGTVNLGLGSTVDGNIIWHAGNDGTGSTLDADTVDGLHASAFATVASPAFTGNPTAPTPAVNDNDTSIATTAYVIGQKTATTPIMDGAAAIGSEIRWAAGDHVHPTDTSRAPLLSPVFTGQPEGPTPPVNDNTTRLATTAFVLGQASSNLPLSNGTATTGTSFKFSREDHIHPRDGNVIITVTTVTQMKALTGLTDGSIIQPFCVNNIFDNSNPPEFRYSTSPVTPNNVTTYSQDVGGGSFHAKYDGRINVRWSGAIGDGSTNDQTKFDACMAIIVANGYGELYIPATTSGYLLNGATAGPDGYKNGILIPFDTVNANPARQISITGEPGARLLCGSNMMALIRNSRNNSRIRNVILDYNSKTDVYLLFTGPEDATQTTTLVSNSFTEIDSVDRIGGPNVSGLVFMPGPKVGGSDSGCFYHNVRDGSSNFVGGGRHVWLRKNVDYGTNPNWPTRTNFYGQRLTRGNVGYHCEEGSEINLFGCHEEAINSGTSPLATPTARYIAAECDNVNFYGGISEACTAATQLFANNVKSYGYVHASGSDASWLTYASSYDDGVNDSRNWTPVVVSSGGGTQGASTSTAKITKQGKLAHFTCQVSVAKGTLAAGTISVTGIPYVADSSWTGASFQMISVPSWSGMTFTPNVSNLQAAISGATLLIRKLHTAGAGIAGLTVAECSDPIVFTVQGTYKTV